MRKNVSVMEATTAAVHEPRVAMTTNEIFGEHLACPNVAPVVSVYATEGWGVNDNLHRSAAQEKSDAAVRGTPGVESLFVIDAPAHVVVLFKPARQKSVDPHVRVTVSTKDVIVPVFQRVLAHQFRPHWADVRTFRVESEFRVSKKFVVAWTVFQPRRFAGDGSLAVITALIFVFDRNRY